MFCKLGYIDSLTDGENYIVDGFAGIEAKRTFDLLEKETDEGILARSRVELLKGRLEEARAKLCYLIQISVNKRKNFIEQLVTGD